MNLFAKIFIGFWVSIAAIIASWLLAGQYFNPFEDELPSPPPAAQGPFAPAEPARPPGGLRDMGPGSRNIYRIFYGLQTVPRDSLQDWIQLRETQDNIDIRLVDGEGREIFGRELLPGSEAVIARLEGFRRRVLHREGDRVLFGQDMFRPEWGPIKLIIARRPPTSPLIGFLTEHLWLRLLLAILISGAISYAISRYLTGPLKNLQRASRQIADGNLDARIQVSPRGGDETDALARDFNSMAAQLQEKVNAQRRLLSDVSHELRSPLARMQVALALAEKDPERSSALMARIGREADLLDNLIGQLLAAPESLEDMPDSIDVVALLKQVCDDATFEARADDKWLSYKSTQQDAVIRSHGDLLKSAFENVVRNAVRHTSPESEVAVSLARQEDRLAVTVEDAGPGVPQAELEKIFEPFYRVDEARQRETGGFGLGLSIARRAIEQHGGRIEAANRPGGGLRVTITLPLSSPLPA